MFTQLLNWKIIDGIFDHAMIFFDFYMPTNDVNNLITFLWSIMLLGPGFK